MIEQTLRSSFAAAAKTVADRQEEINRLNVFPVPDGDTGTNMSLTLGKVVQELDALPADAPLDKVCATIVHASLMGARGNSGVITSQILRGLAESIAESGASDAGFATPQLAAAFRRAVKVAFQAVRKPVEGTILTVLRDVSKRADQCERKKLAFEDALNEIVIEAFDSVARTPELLPVLKENGVVDSGAFGFAVFLESFCSQVAGQDSGAQATANNAARRPSATVADASAQAAALVDIELNDDWEGSEFRYCTEFLFFAERPFDEAAMAGFLSTQGDCELLVGSYPNYKVHVHTDRPDRVLDHMLAHGQIFNVFIHNMDMEAHERTEKLAAEKNRASGRSAGQPGQTGQAGHGAGSAEGQDSVPAPAPDQPPAPAPIPDKEIGIVAVAAGTGQADILRSLGADVVVQGGQTMNPSTADLLDAVKSCNAQSVIILPNNSNIVMAAQSAATAADVPVEVLLTRSVLQGVSALFAFNAADSLAGNAQVMAASIAEVHDGEVTVAVRDSCASDGTPIRCGNVIGIFDDAITHVGSSVADVTVQLCCAMQEQLQGDTLTILAGSELSDGDFESIQNRIAQALPDLDISGHRGEQPLYPVVFSIE